MEAEVEVEEEEEEGARTLTYGKYLAYRHGMLLDGPLITKCLDKLF